MTDTAAPPKPDTDLPPCHPAAELFPLLGGKELRELADDIEAHGLRNPIVVMPDGRILDGRNRWRACQLIGIDPTSTVYEGSEPTSFVLSGNIHRRHLTSGQRAMIAVDALPLLEVEGRAAMSEAAKRAAATRGQGEAGAPHPQNPSSQAATPKQRAPQSRDRAADLTGASGRAVGQAKRVTEADPDLAEKVRNGKLSLNAAEQRVREKQANEQRDVERSRQMGAAPSDASGDGWWLFHGRLAERGRAIPEGTIDLVIVDPPEPAVFMPDVPGLGRQADRLLVEGGVLAVRADLIFLDKILSGLGSFLEFGWVYCAAPGPGRIMPREVESAWQPWIVFTSGAWPRERLSWHTDTPDGPMVDHLVDVLCPAGGAVLDPYCGAGAIAGTVTGSGRRFVGVEQDPQRFEEAKQRMETA